MSHIGFRLAYLELTLNYLTVNLAAGTLLGQIFWPSLVSGSLLDFDDVNFMIEHICTTSMHCSEYDAKQLRYR